MVTPIKLSWIQENLARGDRAAIAKSLGINRAVVYDIISGRLEGKHQASVINTAEKLITKRLRRIQKDKKKYGSVSSTSAA